ncbi:uncharacterized protein N7459_004596 [Penicillium hispanicum]|uniref:uncharacterized protein n=1 Tax=Penicillium hispanicum TaxID=1080232 RepID=UPI0025426280|nr:uncharacterized protein N7459_004596 [Penicillium hispanicum]KAJ5584796.1 hypothetical protein N7459_004596 [Penicillium hispanicum]
MGSACCYPTVSIAEKTHRIAERRRVIHGSSIRDVTGHLSAISELPSRDDVGKYHARGSWAEHPITQIGMIKIG